MDKSRKKTFRTKEEIRISFNSGYWDGRSYQDGKIRRPAWYNHAAVGGGHPFDSVYGAAFVAGAHDFSGAKLSDDAFAKWKAAA